MIPDEKPSIAGRLRVTHESDSSHCLRRLAHREGAGRHRPQDRSIGASGQVLFNLGIHAFSRASQPLLDEQVTAFRPLRLSFFFRLRAWRLHV